MKGVEKVCVVKKRIKRRRMMLAIMLLFSFIIGLTPSSIGNIFAEELNAASTDESVIAIRVLESSSKTIDWELSLNQGNTAMEETEITLTFSPGLLFESVISKSDGTLSFDKVTGDQYKVLFSAVSTEQKVVFQTALSDETTTDFRLDASVSFADAKFAAYAKTQIPTRVIAELVEEPVEEPVEIQVATPVETPEEPIVEIPEETLVETPEETLVVIPEETLVEIPGETIDEQPALETREMLTSDPLEPVSEVLAVGEILSLALPTPGQYWSDPDYTHVLLTGVSINDHTLPYIMWVGDDGNFYFAVKSTHYLKYMYLGSITAPATEDPTDPRYALPYHEYDPWVEIKVDLDTYEPDGLNGNVNDSHWTVFQYPISLLSAGGTYNLFIKGIGGGHDVGSTYTVVPPKVTATVTKTWSGGPMNPVDIQLSRSVDGISWNNVGSPVSLSQTPPANTYTWPILDYTDLTGKIYTYDINEADPGQGYDSTLTSSTLVYNPLTRTYTYTWALLNTYTATGSIVLEAVKDLEGRDLMAGEFSFELKQGATVLQTKSNAADGSITFDAIPYTQADIGQTYTYTITEVAPDPLETGMTYDLMTLTVTVEVTDNFDGTLSATPTYPGDVTFNNSYLATGSIVLEAVKDLAGRDLEAGEFSFDLKLGTAVLQTKTNAADGSITFDAILYTQDDIGETYTYTIEEVAPDPLETGMTYDPMTLTVEVQVTDAGNSILTITPDYPDDVTFNNSYLAAGSIVLEADKVLMGRNLTAGEFSFELKLGTTSVQTKTNALDGTITFDAIHYTQADIGQTYTYTIVEVLPTAPEAGMFYDLMTLTVEVLVEDAGNGNLTITPDYPDDAIFNNTFKTGELQIRKVDDSGDPILGHEATFELRQGAIVVKVEETDITTGIATFENIIIGTYTLIETEAPTGYELNPTVYTVIVQLNSAQNIEVIVKTGGADGTVVPSAPLVVTDKELGSIVIEKLDSITSAPLSGAEFDLYREVPSGTAGAATFTMLDSTVIYGIKVNTASLVTGTDGKTPAVGNLVQGDYFTVETKAPIGYDLLEEPVRMTLQFLNLTMTYQLNNNKSPQIPQTGGVGTMVFSIVGIGLMFGALLGYKKYNTNGKNKKKGENIMKGRKFFTILLTFLVLFVFIAPTMAKAIGSVQTGTLTLHKFEYSSDDNMVPIPGTGMPNQPIPLGTTPLAGVIFEVTRVADNAELPDPAPLMIADVILYQEQLATDSSGLAVFALLPQGRYLVEEISGPANITTPTPDFIIDIPMMNTNRVDWNWDVHVYPKNETKYGTVELTKTVEGLAMPTGKSATFQLWTDKNPVGIGGLDVRYPNDTTTFTTDVNGKIVVSGLPVGNYYFIETIPPEGYALDNTPVTFTISEHSYLDDNEWVNLVSKTMDDKLKPTIDKDINTPGTEKDSGGYADPVTWIIRPSIPTNIATYTSFVVTDAIDPRLDFITLVPTLEVSVAGTPRLVLIRDTDYTVTEPVVTDPPSGRPVPNNLVITFTAAGRAKLEHESDLQISFKTFINETAVMGAEIPNTATLSYNNGFGQTGTATVPTDEIPVAWTGGYKFLKMNNAQTPVELAGAEFKVYRLDGVTKLYFTGTEWTTAIDNALVYTTGTDGIVDIMGLHAGPYFLLETKAPWNAAEGLPYNLLTEPIEFEVTQTSYTATMTTIINKMGPKIPQTGGIGTLLFTITGLGLMGSAMMIGKKKSTR